MSLLGPVDDTDRRIWQQRNLVALTELVQLGAKQGLSPLFWTLPNIGTITGKVDAYSASNHPRAVFEDWFAALARHGLVDPRGLGLRGDGEHRHECTTDSGQTRMIAAFTLRLGYQKHPSSEVALIAEWFEDQVTPDAPTVDRAQ